MVAASQPAFYFDLGSPYAYLAFERLDELFAKPVALRPISLGALFKLTGRSSWSLGNVERRRRGIAEVERRARTRDLPSLRWPQPWPGNYLTAMRAATYAEQIGRGSMFARCAFRAAFVDGHDLSLLVCVLAAAREAGLDPDSVEQAIADPQIKLALRETTAEAHTVGVIGVPTVAVAGELFWGDDCLEEAAARAARS